MLLLEVGVLLLEDFLVADTPAAAAMAALVERAWASGMVTAFFSGLAMVRSSSCCLLVFLLF